MKYPPTRPSRPTPPPHSFLGLSAEELKQMLCEEEKNVNDTARSFSSDAERMTALQTGDAGLSGEVPNLQDGVISSPLGRSSHGNDVSTLGHVAALDDIAQGTSDGFSDQNIVESKRLRNTADECSWESKRSKNGPSTTQRKNQKPAAVSQLGSRSNEDAAARPEHSATLDDITQSSDAGSSGQNIVDLKKLRIAAGRSSESKRFKVCSPKTLVGGQRSAVVSTLGPSSDGDASVKPEHSATLDDIPPSSDAGSSGQNIVEPKRLRNAADGCSWENKRFKNGSSTSQGKSQKPAATSPLGPSSDGDASAKSEHPGNKRSPKNYFPDSGKIRCGLVTWILVGIMLIITPRGYSNLPVNLSKAFASYSNIRICENRFSEGSTSTERHDDQDLCETTGLKAAGSPSSSSTQRMEVPSQVDGNKSSDKKDETLTTPQNLDQADDKPWLRWFLAVQMVLGPFIYAYANNYFINPSNPISVIDAVPMNLATTLSIWIVCSSSLSEAINISRSLVKLQG